MLFRALCSKAGHTHSNWWAKDKASPSENTIVLALKKSSQKLGDLKASDSVHADL